MLLETLKENYKKTFTEPRLSGRSLSDEYWKPRAERIDEATNLNELIEAVGFVADPGSAPKNIERHIIARIIAWENEPPVYYNEETKQWQREPIKN